MLKALRGAADAFGIVINFYLQTEPAPSTVVNWSFGIPGMFVSAKTSTDAFLHIQDFARNASVIDRKISFGSYLDGQGFSIGGTYFGTLDDFNNKVRLLSLLHPDIELMRRWTDCARIVTRTTNTIFQDRTSSRLDHKLDPTCWRGFATATHELR